MENDNRLTRTTIPICTHVFCSIQVIKLPIYRNDYNLYSIVLIIITLIIIEKIIVIDYEINGHHFMLPLLNKNLT